jgi:hypothetical protein
MKFDFKILLALFVDPIFLLFIKPKRDPDPPIETANIPTTSPGTEIEILFGERLQEDPLLYWYGDLQVEPFYSKQKKKK